MSGRDKYYLAEDLKKLGWEEVEYPNKYKPPQSLWDSRPEFFNIYNARDLQDELGELTEYTKDQIEDIEK